MLIKFMGGRGGGGPIASYLVDARRAGREEAAPEVVRGDIERTRELIDSIDRKWTYTTGVISFAVEDAPSGGPAAGGDGRLRAGGLRGHGPRAVRHHLGAPQPYRRTGGRTRGAALPDRRAWS